MARLQELQYTVAGGAKVISGVSLSPRSTRGYLRTSLRCKQESLRYFFPFPILLISIFGLCHELFGSIFAHIGKFSPTHRIVASQSVFVTRLRNLRIEPNALSLNHSQWIYLLISIVFVNSCAQWGFVLSLFLSNLKDQEW